MPAKVMIGRERGIQAAKFFRVCLQRLQLPGGSKLGDEEEEEEEGGGGRLSRPQSINQSINP